MCKDSMYKNVIAYFHNILHSKVLLYDFMSLKVKKLTHIYNMVWDLQKLQSFVALVVQNIRYRIVLYAWLYDVLDHIYNMISIYFLNWRTLIEE